VICLLVVLGGLGCGSSVTADVDTMEAPAKKYSVTAYGAKGDGINDDAPAIQGAMNAAAGSGGIVTFPCGEFSIRSVAGSAPAGRSLLYLKNVIGVQLTGQGSCSHLFTTMPEKSVLEFEGGSLMSVTQLKVTALNANYVETFGMDGGSAVRFTNVSKGSISHVEVDGASAGALYFTNGTSSSTLISNYVHDTYGSGIWEDSCGSANAQNCNPEKSPMNNVFDSNTLTNTLVAGGGGTAALNLDDGGASANTLIRNNTISWSKPLLTSNNQVNCIQVNNASNATVTNNSCSGTPWNGIAVTAAGGVSITNITIQGNMLQNSGSSTLGGNGIEVYAAPHAIGISAVTISGNTISVAANSGIAIWNTGKPGGITAIQITSNSISMADQLNRGSSFGIDVENSAGVTSATNTISCDGKCIAAGINVYASTASSPLASSNQISNILGLPLRIY
jgi:hypothetical protein